ncbi:hypothetical protein C922_05534 [Plasmodium inui San Antonio 1]|uniref:Uncharacterized protein n=1 Tax=Plasmodium inui San Antonio 1 TaxID=1237626 RepID=W6ZXV1_9APIC|nr:hypothetical protein C922_05534 [Plasmodium inui San Antonio 1]EUD64085.1 hypothetical protein C922_05534 [Plasmodium inui San Antonio 1]
MGPSFGAYMKSYWDLAKCHKKNPPEEPKAFKLCDLDTKGLPTKFLIPSARGPELTQGTFKSTESIRVRTIMVCQALEGWVSNLQPSSSSNGTWKEAQCKMEHMGFPRGGRQTKTCPINNDKENWRSFYSATPLHLQQETSRTFQTCLDIMGIILNIYNEYSGERLQGAEEEGSNICQQINDKLTEWGGEEVGKKIMKEWFLRDPKKETSSSLTLETGTPLSEKISRLVKELGFPIAGVQCSSCPGLLNSYKDSCVYIDSKSCQMMGGDEETLQGQEANSASPPSNRGPITTELIAQVKAKEGDTQYRDRITKETVDFKEELRIRAEEVTRKNQAPGRSPEIYGGAIGEKPKYLEIDDRKPLSQHLSMIADDMNIPVLGVQCSEESNKPGTYRDSCVYTSPGHCEGMDQGSDKGEDSIEEVLINKVKETKVKHHQEERIREGTKGFTEATEKGAQDMRKKLEGDSNPINIYIPNFGTIFPLLGLNRIFYSGRRKRRRVKGNGNSRVNTRTQYLIGTKL